MNRDETKRAAEEALRGDAYGATDRELWLDIERRKYARALLAYMEREEKNIDVERFRDDPPCYICGYNGPGYFQPLYHACAAYYHAAIKAAEEGRG